MVNAGPRINQIFASLVWAERILFYLSPAQMPLDIPSDEESDNEDLDEEEERSFLGIDTLKNDVLNEGSDEMLKSKFLNCLGEIFSHTRGRNHVTCVSLEEGDEDNVVRVARNDGFESGKDGKDALYFRKVEHFLSSVGRIGNVFA